MLSAALLMLWILLMQSVSAGTLLLGVALAIFWPAVTAHLRPRPVKLRHPVTLLRLVGRVIIDMLQSNAEVAWAIISRRSDTLPSAFVKVPLELSDANGLAVLSMIVTFTPGTAWVQLSADGKVLLLHVLVARDEARQVAFIKQRYERPLMEIFQ
jgi:multicomponent K+:H+ antiporter subunit E